ncbi:MAG TPA: hypothetical protein VK155_17545 [Bacteroidales bacterium]|nr:hypothetical protein [Bacteroidales bacterium]
MRAFLLILLFASMFSCRKEDDHSNLMITAGFICGWGSGEDSLVITRSEINYLYFIPAKSREPVKQAMRKTQESEWNEIVDAVNYSEFAKLNYNTCNVCVDGCDEWVSLQDDDFDHAIRYTKGQEINSIKRLQEILSRLRAEFAK